MCMYLSEQYVHCCHNQLRNEQRETLIKTIYRNSFICNIKHFVGASWKYVSALRSNNNLSYDMLREVCNYFTLL